MPNLAWQQHFLENLYTRQIKTRQQKNAPLSTVTQQKIELRRGAKIEKMPFITATLLIALIEQAMAERLRIVAADRALPEYGIKVP